MARLVSFVVLLAAVIVTGIFFYRVMAGFILPIFLAMIAVMIFQPVFRWLLVKLKGRRRTAAALTTAAVFLTVLLPVVFVVGTATLQAIHVIARLDGETLRAKTQRLRDQLVILQMPQAASFHGVESTLQQLLDTANHPPPSPGNRAGDNRTPLVESLLRHLEGLEDLATDTPKNRKAFDALRSTVEKLAAEDGPPPGSLEFAATVQAVTAQYRDLKSSLLGGPIITSIKELANPSDEEFRRLSQSLFLSARDWLLAIGSRTSVFLIHLVVGIGIMLISTYFFFLDGPEMTRAAMRLSPLDDHYEELLVREFETVNRAVVLATLLSALSQAILGAVGYWLAGLPAVILLSVLTGALAMVPFVGATVVWFPATLFLLYQDRTLAAVFLFFYGALVISLADNVVKPWVLHGQSKLHPLLALLSVLGGVQALGPIGIVAGPLAASMLQTLLNLLHREIMELDTREGLAEPKSAK